MLAVNVDKECYYNETKRLCNEESLYTEFAVSSVLQQCSPRSLRLNGRVVGVSAKTNLKI